MNVLKKLLDLMGWCPNTGMQPNRRRDLVYPASCGTCDVAPPCNRRIAVDYQLVNNRFILLGLLAVVVYFILALIGLFLPDLRPGFYTLSGLAFMAYAGLHFYLDTKRAEIEFSGNDIIIRRPLFGPLVFEKSSVSSIQEKKTHLPVPRWVFGLLYLLLGPAVLFSMTQVNAMRWMNGYAVLPDFAFSLFLAAGVTMFMLELGYRSFARLYYPGFLKVSLKPDGTLHLYSENPEALAAMLEART